MTLDRPWLSITFPAHCSQVSLNVTLLLVARRPSYWKSKKVPVIGWVTIAAASFRRSAGSATGAGSRCAPSSRQLSAQTAVGRPATLLGLNPQPAPKYAGTSTGLPTRLHAALAGQLARGLQFATAVQRIWRRGVPHARPVYSRCDVLAPGDGAQSDGSADRREKTTVPSLEAWTHAEAGVGAAATDMLWATNMGNTMSDGRRLRYTYTPRGYKMCD
jgi:hypothetical protein